MNSKRFSFVGGMGLLLLFGFPFFFATPNFSHTNALATEAASAGYSLYYTFNSSGTLDEAGSITESWSPYWWLNSGGQFFLSNGLGKTVQGELSSVSPWRIHYASANPTDTDNGYHPQNIFRLVTRSTWQNLDQRVKFRITKINMSESPERDGWSGILLFNRYVNEDNLYYAGIRADGHAVIKKKKNGTYYTLTQTAVYTADSGYDRDTNPNLIPGKRWIGLRSVVTNESGGGVRIRLYVDKQNNGVWTLVAEALDDGLSYGGSSITQGGYTGIRTDFMDVEFDDYKATAL